MKKGRLMAMNTYNVTVIPIDSKIAMGYLFEAENITGAIKKGEEYGTVVKAVLDGWDE